jgi:hypothetical protein
MDVTINPQVIHTRWDFCSNRKSWQAGFSQLFTFADVQRVTRDLTALPCLTKATYYNSAGNEVIMQIVRDEYDFGIWSSEKQASDGCLWERYYCRRRFQTNQGTD